jgi:hypothetical protein
VLKLEIQSDFMNEANYSLTSQHNYFAMINDSVIEFKDATIFQGDVPVITNLNLTLIKVSLCIYWEKQEVERVVY